MLAKHRPLPHAHQVRVSTGPCSRRILLTGAIATAGLVALRADGKPRARKLPVLPLKVAVATWKGKPVVSDAWIEQQVSRAQELLAPHQVRIALAGKTALPERYAQLEDAEDRDALAAELSPRVINAFVVQSLRDVDDPKRTRMGVRWRLRRNVSKDYVIVAASALPSTLCHELGHYFGNGHSQVVNNVMSYKRDDPAALRFNKRQGKRMRQVAWKLLARGRLRSADQ